MLTSKKLELRRSEIRQSLAELANKEKPTADETRAMVDLDQEYRTSEVQYRAALVSEDEERRTAGQELETRAGAEWDELMAGFEVRQAALALDEGAALSGQTAEIVQELRSQGGYRGIPVPWGALETRNTVASGTPDPVMTRPIIDRLFPDSVAGRMGAALINIDSGSVEYPVVTSAVTAGWGASEAGNVPTGAAYQTTDRPLKPDHNLGVQMRITRKTLKQSGQALEAAIRRDMQGAMAASMDRATFLGTGADGQPLGVVTGAASYGILATAVGAAASWAVFRAAVTEFLIGNAASGPAAVRLLLRPEVWDALDDSLITGTAISEWDRLTRQIPASNITQSSNALAAPAGSPDATTAVMTTSAGGVPPIFVATWGAIDLVRDPFTDAQSGGLRLTALATMDLTVARPGQLRILPGIE